MVCSTGIPCAVLHAPRIHDMLFHASANTCYRSSYMLCYMVCSGMQYRYSPPVHRPLVP